MHFKQKCDENKYNINWTTRAFQAILEEFENYGTEADKECLDYVLNAKAGSSNLIFQDGLKRDCDADGKVLKSRLKSDGKGGMSFVDFVAIGKEEPYNLKEEHVLALRLALQKLSAS